MIESGRFYPPAVRTPHERLAFFARHFPITEVDTSYYGMPDPDTVQNWVDATPEGFVFDVKAFRLFTRHRTPLKALPPDLREALEPRDKPNVYYDDVPEELRSELWARFRASLEPFDRAGKLGVVLLQYAPWFVYRPSSFDHMAECVAELQPYRAAVEMRNKSWFYPSHCAETLARERELGLAHVVVDEPQGFASSVEQVWEVTRPDVAVVRLHGRNRAMWHGSKAVSAAERFDYLYDDAELAELVEPVEQLAARADDVHVLFNNCHQDNAQRNATQFLQMMQPRDLAQTEHAPPV